MLISKTEIRERELLFMKPLQAEVCYLTIIVYIFNMLIKC